MKKHKYKTKRNYNECLKESNIIEIKNQSPNYKFKKLPKIFYSNNVTSELEKNNYDNREIINPEQKDHLYDEIDSYTINIYITKIKNISETLIPENYFINIEIIPDGDCFFHAVSKFLSNNQNYDLYIRNIIYNYIIKNQDYFRINNPYIHNNKKVILFDEYLPNIIKPGNYAGELEIYITSKIFNISIYVYEYQKAEKKYRYLYSYINNEEFISHCMILNHVYLDTGAEHYELLKINSFV